MRNYTGIVIRRSRYALKFMGRIPHTPLVGTRHAVSLLQSLMLLLIMCPLLVGCAIFSDMKPKPVPMGEVRFHIQEGDKYLNAGNYDKALESYAAAVKLNPESIDARRKLGEAHAARGEMDLALDEFAKITEINPNYSHAYNYRGFLYNNQKKWEEAAKEFESALKVEPDNLYSLNHLGLMYKMMGRFEDARDALQKAVELDPEMDDPESRDTHNYLGLLYQDQGEYEKAIAEFRKTSEHFPTDTNAHNYLGTVFENTGKYQDAAEEYGETLKIDPEDAFARSRMEALQQSGAIFYELPSVEIVKDDADHYISSAPDASEYTDAGAVVLLDKLSYEVTGGGLTRYTIHQIVKICDQRGIAEFGEVAVPFNPKYQSIGVNVARTILPDGTEVAAAMDAFHDITPPGLAEYNLYSDMMLKVISMPALQPGAILEYKVTVEDVQATAEKFWVLGGMAFQWVEPILTSKCVLRMPKDIKIKWKLYNCQIDPVITEDDENLTYIWISKNNPEIIPEVAMPPFDEVIPLLVFSTAESWEEVYEWYKDLAEPQERADKAIKRKVAELIAGKITKEEKAKAIFEFVASEIRYVAIELGQGAYQPYPAADVFKYRYGDCKDKVTLLITMLREADIDAYPVLISPAPHRRADEEMPSVGQFSHVIAAVPVEEDSARNSITDARRDNTVPSIQHPESSIQYFWLDPTIATCRYGDLPAGDQGRRAFVIGKDGGQFVDTPVYPSELNKIASASEITLMEDGTIRGWERTTARGQAAMYLRAVYRLIRPDRRKEFLETMLNQRYPGVQIEDVSMSDLYDLDTPVEVKVDFSCPGYGMEARLQSGSSDQGEMLIFPLPGEEFSAYAALVGPAGRKYDLHLGYNMAVERTLALSFPEGYRVASLPRDISVKHEFGTFARKYEAIPPHPPLTKGGAKEDLAKGGAREGSVEGGAREDLAKGGAREDLAKEGPREDLVNGGARKDLANGEAKEALLKEGSGEDLAEESEGKFAVRYSVSLKIDTPVIPAASYADFKKFLETAAREDRAQIVLTKVEQAGSLFMKP